MQRRLLRWIALVGFIMAAPSAGAATFAEIQNKGQILTCAFDNRLPYSNSEGDVRGLQIDLAEEIAKDLGVALDVRWILYRFHARRAGCDMQMGTVARIGKGDDDDDDDERASNRRLQGAAGQQIFNLRQRVRPKKSDPYFASTTHLVATETLAKATEFSDLKGHKVAALHGSWAHFMLDQNGIKPVTRYETDIAILDALVEGEIDAGIVASTYFGWFGKTHPEAKLAIADGFDLDSDMTFNVAVSLRGADEALIKRVNETLARLRSEGWLASLYQKYGIPYQAPRTAK